eukprot:TRINITY_DN15732_c0_g1_i1.p1 TRINITY_DN15732_c0_g1~~TRINITY_DN15732_c0_g1_i1.p1  ORF type:complete len:525 (-),score=56.56 TRINITY_DN15732_c0_g1_i1:51-1583(-)
MDVLLAHSPRKRKREDSTTDEYSKRKKTEEKIDSDCTEAHEVLLENSDLRIALQELRAEVESLKKKQQKHKETIKSLTQQNKRKDELCSALQQENTALNVRLLELQRLVEEVPCGPMAFLPHEMLYCIFQYLTLHDSLLVQQVCKKWNEDINTWLEYLDMSPFYHHISDDTITGITKFKNLKRLSLSRCQQVTDFGIKRLTSKLPLLVHLNLSGCKVSNFTHLQSLAHLKSLHFGNSPDITETTLDQLPTDLTSLDLSWCSKIENAGLGHLRKLTCLKDLRVSQCESLKIPSFIMPTSFYTTLTKLTIDRQSYFLDPCLASLSNLTGLTTLHLFRVLIRGTTFQYLQGLQNFRELRLRRCHAFTDEGLEQLQKVTSLTTLEITGISKITDQGLSYLTLPNLRNLNLHCGPTLFLSDLSSLFFNDLRLEQLQLSSAVNLSPKHWNVLVDSQKASLKRLKMTEPLFTIKPTLNVSNFFPELKRFNVIKGLEKYTWREGDSKLLITKEVADNG